MIHLKSKGMKKNNWMMAATLTPSYHRKKINESRRGDHGYVHAVAVADPKPAQPPQRRQTFLVPVPALCRRRRTGHRSGRSALRHLCRSGAQRRSARPGRRLELPSVPASRLRRPGSRPSRAGDPRIEPFLNISPSYRDRWSLDKNQLSNKPRDRFTPMCGRDWHLGRCLCRSILNWIIDWSFQAPPSNEMIQ